MNFIDDKIIKNSEFNKLSFILKDLTGINLSLNSKNIVLMSSRLKKVLLKLGNISYKDLIAKLESNDSVAIKLFVIAMTTNTTYFFRENDHFDFLSKNIHQLCSLKIKARENELRIWCAAASSGEEAYTILITLLESGIAKDIKIKMLATDIDANVIRQAIEAVYSQEKVKNVPLIIKQKYFTKMIKNNLSYYAINQDLKSYIKFGVLNLLDDKYPFKYKFDIIFCRNVLIYFDNQTSKMVINKLVDVLNVGGYLFLGHSEVIVGKIQGLQRIGTAIYQKISNLDLVKISA